MFSARKRPQGASTALYDTFQSTASSVELDPLVFVTPWLLLPAASSIAMASAKAAPKSKAAAVSEVIVLSDQGVYNWAQGRHPTVNTLFLDIRSKKEYDACHILNAVHVDIQQLSQGDPSLIDSLDGSVIERSFTNSVSLSKWQNRAQNRLVVVGCMPYSMMEPDSSEVAFIYFLMGCCDGARIACLENGMGKFWNTYPFLCEVSPAPAAVLSATDQRAASSPPSQSSSSSRTQEYWASEIIEARLWLGNQNNAESLKRLRDLGITHVLNCAGEMLNYWDGNSMEMEGPVLVYHKLNIQDTTGTSILPLFDQVWDFLSGALADSRNRVFVTHIHIHTYMRTYTNTIASTNNVL